MAIQPSDEILKVRRATIEDLFRCNQLLFDMLKDQAKGKLLSFRDIKRIEYCVALIKTIHASLNETIEG